MNQPPATSTVRQRLLSASYFEDATGQQLDFDASVHTAPPKEAKYLKVKTLREAKTIWYRIDTPMPLKITRIASFSSMWSGQLMLAMSRPSMWERFFQVCRRGVTQRRWPVDDAIIFCTDACERCANIQAYVYGLDWGVRPDSQEAEHISTHCAWCDHPEERYR